MTESLYWSLDKCDRASVPFNFIIGGRGTGKTYCCLTRAYVESNDELSRFMYMRRMETEIASIANERYNPFKKLNTDKNWNIQANYSSQLGIGEFFTKLDESKETVFHGYGAALSTFGKLRGADLSDVNKIVFDEFIKTKVARPIKDEADLFFNAYETVNRNREIMGFDPVTCYLLSNATTLNSPILEELNLVTVIEKMKRDRQFSYTDRERGVHIELLDNIAVSAEKANTALYQLTEKTAYFQHAIENEFAYDSFENIKKVQLNEYTAYIQVDNLYIYKHKNRLEYYVTHAKSKCDHKFTGDAVPLFKRNFGGRFHTLMLGGYVYYESFAVKQEIFSLYQ